MREKLKQLIAEHLIRRGQLKVALHNRDSLGMLTESERDEYLDEINDIDKSIETLTEILKAI
ncbi:hypothetical protein [Dyadobacter luticola]|uniref:Uncharacterized protein n=1 Tax=Dyadobacter luticola TaxID=1979387 RepID=A0A5R9KS55_9BACT|nr:hypothetical protein [Dyadobacter luticola]TLU98916.1 hypothetical protein FEN17_20200 [Dyadobacter luticola]